MKENNIWTKFLVSFSGQIEFAVFPAGVFDNQLYIQYDIVWGPDWEPLSGLCSGTSQLASSGKDPEKVVFNLPLEMVFGSTNVFGWPQLIVTVRAKSYFLGDSLRGYAVFLLPPITGPQELISQLVRPQSATILGEWLSWLTGRHPELADPKMLTSGKDNYLLKTESYGYVAIKISMVSKDLRKLGYDNQAPVLISGGVYFLQISKMVAFFLLIIAAAATAVNLPPSCRKPVYCDSKLLHYVQMHRIFTDSKTFVDRHLFNDEESTLAAFDDLLKETNDNPTKKQVEKFVDKYFDKSSELESWQPSDYDPNPQFLSTIRDEKLRKFAKDINNIWPTLGRKVKQSVFDNPDQFSFIPVKHGFIIPGGRFTELYYWDTYWIIEGLLVSGMEKTVRGVIENLIELVNKLGHIPNGSRWYYEQRSQPPLLTAMMSLYLRATNDIDFLKKNIDALEAELQYWLDTQVYTFEIGDKAYTLLRYYAASEGPRPESYYEDYTSAQMFETDERKTQFYVDIKSAAESGWDFSTRWFIKDGSDKGNLTDIHSTDIIPVDLNAIFAKALQNMAYFQSLVPNRIKAKHWDYLADQWSNNIQKVLWDEADGCWHDWDLANKKFRKYFYPSNVAPLWMGVADKPFVAANAPRILNYLKGSHGLDYPGGVPTSLVRSGEQWDFPNAWPPLVSLTVNALEALELPSAKELGFRVAQTWVRSCYKGFSDNKQMFEKYDVEVPGRIGGGGEYTVQTGFGWTNGVILEFIAKYGQRMSLADKENETLQNEPALNTDSEPWLGRSESRQLRWDSAPGRADTRWTEWQSRAARWHQQYAARDLTTRTQ
ncbi:unnamed protein product [Leptosia nina]|uniref:Trehalase n=1 Tax=Leptosia nina TaxID=320188 RepID=A0AAV1JDD0_9NEOP